ncbi:carnitine 3-dehydrogenase [Abyssibius alkaniclasticus]|uniref:carnitine 3-dehydrogenase n=1 Tax=Abyssibius alkaniclasticus TaxID=2881234 RepID=UPI002364A18C|nr:carnitine 3-dehydrogenase [Abyssibius alkaniclasticus]UPH72675.1 carnitine 3-dehydrogenase [Abyssibius alkaniclasticus]
MTKTAAIIGGGVIGGGWAARFLLNGWDVRISDPDPEAARKIGEVLANARRSLPALADVAMPPEGRLSFATSIAEAVAGADWVQESVPERLDIKHRVFAEIQAYARADAVIGSSTSGFKPSELQQGAARPGQIFVCHPFNPVYLLPLIEVVGSDVADPAIRQTCVDTLEKLGMKPLLVRKEIDAHIADRFLEAVWREALWLVKDGIATTEEIDDAIRFGFGLRWGQMGLFETYRIAGGEAGMKHFIAQFGPCLAWPWTKLMDVPELTDELVETLASQSDAQSGMHSIRELERIRDDNLVGMMRALKRNNWGAGALLVAQDRRMGRTAPALGLVETQNRQVPQSWTDYNGHMNEAHYLEVFAAASDRFMEIIGADADYIAAGNSYFTAETHIRHIDEVHAGARVRVETQVLAGAGKKLHLFHSLFEGARLLATGEHLLLHVNLNSRATSEPLPDVVAKLADYAKAHATMPRPEGAGRAVGQKP